MFPYLKTFKNLPYETSKFICNTKVTNSAKLLKYDNQEHKKLRFINRKLKYIKT